ncbi:MFS transporter [Arthrobacter sp. NPDC093139]|uniref:MFS transporter n=1 Tax=Arthrobacter sp. NPDC093139 TaxID=3363945 RepID=UPI0037FCFF5F
MAPAHPRGRMVTINGLMIVAGQMLAFAINALLDALIHDPQVWRLMLGVAMDRHRSRSGSAGDGHHHGELLRALDP